MRHPYLKLLTFLVWHAPLTKSANHVFSNADGSDQDKHDALVAAQIAFPVLFGQVRRSAWNDYAKQKRVSELVLDEDIEEQKIRKTMSREEADKYINNARTDGLNRDLYHSQYNTAVLDGTVTVMGQANDTYMERSIYLKSGGGIVIPCMLASIPMDSFRWYDDIDDQSFSSKFSGALSVNEKKQLSIHNAAPFISGIYRCIGSHKGNEVKNVVYLYVYKTADPGLMFSVHYRTADCDEARIAFRQNEILKFLCDGETGENCIDEKVPICRMETKVDVSQLRGRLELIFIRYDTDFQNDCAGECEAEQKISRILANRPFKDLRKGLLDYLAYDDRLYASHFRDYLWDPVRTLAEGYYTKHQTYRCSPGFVVHKAQDKPACVPCFAGSSKANLSRAAVCPECPVGSYAPSAALQYCEICPTEYGTIANHKGNKKQDDCFSRPVTYRPRPALEMDFAGFEDEPEKQETQKSNNKTVIIVIVSIFLVVVAIGGFLYYRQSRAKKDEETAKAGDSLEAEAEEKQPLAPGKVPSVTALPTESNATANNSPFNFLTQAMGIRPAKQEAPAEAKKDKAKGDNATEVKKTKENNEGKTIGANKSSEDDTAEEAKKVKRTDKNTTAEANDEDEDPKSNAGSRHSHSSEVDTPKAVSSVPGSTPGQTNPAQAASPYASTYPSTYSSAFASVVPTSAQPYHAGNPQQMMAQPGYPPQMTGQSGNHQEG